MTDYNEYVKFGRNTISHTFLQSYINKMRAYYSFNQSYVTDGSSSLVTSSAVFGLAVGLTDRDYNVRVDGKLKQDGTLEHSQTIDYNNKLIISLDLSGEEIRNTYEPLYGGNKYELSPISNVVTNKLQYNTSFPSNSTNLMLIYIIGYDTAKYEAWSTTLGYTDKYIVVSEQVLEEVSAT